MHLKTGEFTGISLGSFLPCSNCKWAIETITEGQWQGKYGLIIFGKEDLGLPTLVNLTSQNEVQE